MAKKSYEQMTRKELLRIAKLHGIKGRHRMKKADLIKAIKAKNKPIKELSEIEKEIKSKKLEENYNKNHIELLPQEPGIIYVHWDLSKRGKKENVTLRLKSKRKTILEIPVPSSKGKGYLRVEEGEPLKASVGIKKGRKFVPIVSSEEILVPYSKPVSNKKVIWAKVNPETGKVTKEKEKLLEEKVDKLDKKREKTEKEAKTVKYIRIPKEK